MYTPRLNSNPALTNHVISGGFIRKDPFCLVDVGASGGIEYHWRAFGQDLCAFGFDRLINEVERLNAQSRTDGRIIYFPYLVGYKKYGDLLSTSHWNTLPNNQPYGRSSCIRAHTLMQCDFIKTYFDQTGQGVLTNEKIELDEFFLKTNPHNVDFIKIDTDGSDYEVLLGAKELIRDSGVLGCCIECQFHGLLHDHANIFSNVDKLLRELGFSLFDIEVQRYSRACLPKRFWYRIPASTLTGQVLWADGVYLRDASADGYEQTWGISLSVEKLLKLACVFEIIGLEDCAAELC